MGSMLRRAEWRKLQDDPETPLGWWWRAVGPRLPHIERPKPSPQPRSLWWTALHTVALTLLTFFVVIASLETAFFGAAFLLLLGVGAMAFVCDLLWARPLSDLETLLPSPSPGESFFVRLTFRHRGTISGQDEAVATLLDGWLHIEGLHTSFSLRACDVGRLFPLPGGGQSLELSDDQRVEFRPYGDRGVMDEPLRIWHYYAIESPEGKSLLPPLESHPSAAVRPIGRRLFFALSVLAGIALSLVSPFGWVFLGGGTAALLWSRRRSALQWT